MEDKIQEIISKASEMKQNGIDDSEIAKIVHINLGKIIIYDNNYSAKFENTKDGEEITRNEQRKTAKFTK